MLIFFCDEAAVTHFVYHSFFTFSIHGLFSELFLKTLNLLKLEAFWMGYGFLSFEVLSAVTVRNVLLLCVAPCNLVFEYIAIG